MSPQWQISQGETIPPFLVAYTGEKKTRIQFSTDFVKTLQEAGISAEILPAPEKTHGAINSEFGEPNDRVSNIVFDWLENILLQETE
jgi:acetyl esterase/lipase